MVGPIADHEETPRQATCDNMKTDEAAFTR